MFGTAPRGGAPDTALEKTRRTRALALLSAARVWCGIECHIGQGDAESMYLVHFSPTCNRRVSYDVLGESIKYLGEVMTSL